MDRYLYFRTEATDADDDARGDSACFPSSSFMGMQPVGDSELGLYFKSMRRGIPSGNEPDADASFDNHDSVVLNLTTANTHLVAMQAITKAIFNGRSHTNGTILPSLIIIANDDSGGTEYLEGSGIASCGTISVASAYAN
jgi:hypothetical protein